MLFDPTWQEMQYCLVEGGFFDFEARPKTLGALRRAVERMSREERVKLLETVSIVFAPAPGKYGEVYPFSDPVPDSGQPQDTVMVYLSPELERRRKDYVESVVAHELAHVLLHRFNAPAPSSIEREADEKVRSWGFKSAYSEDEYPAS